MSDTSTPGAPSDAPIVVNANPAQDGIETLIRQILLVLAAVASALGYSGVAGKFGALLAITGPLAALVVIIIGQVKTLTLAHKAAVMASDPRLPNASTKPGWVG
jgi:hypothetical protein